MFRFPASYADRAAALVQVAFAVLLAVLAVRDAHAARWGWLLFDVALLGVSVGVLWGLCRCPGGAR